jgi:hypothetical protein
LFGNDRIAALFKQRDNGRFADRRTTRDYNKNSSHLETTLHQPARYPAPPLLVPKQSI